MEKKLNQQNNRRLFTEIKKRQVEQKKTNKRQIQIILSCLKRLIYQYIFIPNS